MNFFYSETFDVEEYRQNILREREIRRAEIEVGHLLT